MERSLRRGRVVDADGQAVARALVSVVWGTSPTPEIGRRTGDDGAFRVGLPQGLYRLRAVTAAGSVGEVEIEGGEGGEDSEILIRLPAAPGAAGR